MSANDTPQVSPEREPFTRREKLLIVLSAILAVAVRVAFGNRRDFWIDEYLTLNTALNTWSVVVSNRLAVGHSPLYFFYAKLFTYVDHDSYRWLRFSSAMMTGVGVVGASLLLRNLGLKRHLPALLCLAPVFPYWIEIGTLYRYMMPLFAVTCFLFAVAIRHAQQPTFARGVVFSLLACLLVWLHATGQFILAALIVFLLWDTWSTRPHRLAGFAARIAPPLLGMLSGIPLLLITRSHFGEKIEQKALKLSTFDESILETVYGDVDFYNRLIDTSPNNYQVPLGILLVAAVWLAFRRLTRDGKFQARRFFATYAIGIPVAILVFQLATGHYFTLKTRYVGVLSIVFMLLLSVAWNAPVRPRPRVLLRVGLAIGIGLQTLAAGFSLGDYHRQALDWTYRYMEDGNVPLFFRVRKANRMGLQRRGYWGPLIDYPPREDLMKLSGFQNWYRAHLRDGRGMFLIYFGGSRAIWALEDMEKKGEVIAFRWWKMHDQTKVGAFITNRDQLPWLASLEHPTGLLGRPLSDREAGRRRDEWRPFAPPEEQDE